VKFKRKISNRLIIIIFTIWKHFTKPLIIFLVASMIFGSLPIQEVNAARQLNTDELNEVSVPYSEITNQEETYSHEDIKLRSENVSLRTSTEKHFIKENGSFEAYIRSKPFANDDLNPILSNFDSQKSNDFSFSNGEISYRFPSTLNSKTNFSIQVGQSKLKWSILNQIGEVTSIVNHEKILSNEKYAVYDDISTIKYPSIINNLDLVYEIKDGSVKEFIIFNQKTENSSVSFYYQTHDLELHENDNNIQLVDPKTGNMYTFDPLYMVDANGDTSHEVTYEIIETKGGFFYTVIPNKDWLSSAEFPVIIDPSVKITNASNDYQDTYTSEYTPTATLYNDAYMNVGMDSSYEQRGFVNIQLNESTFQNKVISYAFLVMKVGETSYSNQVNLHENLTTPNVTNLSWNNMPANNNSVIDYVTAYNTSDILRFDISQYLSNKILSDSSSYDLSFVLIDDDGIGKTKFYQSGSHEEPYVIIGYEDANGLKNHWSYTSQNAGLPGTGFLSDYTGHLTWVRNDYQLNTEIMSIGLDFIYSINSISSNANDVAYGNGWKTGFDYKLMLGLDLESYYLVKPDSSVVHFYDDKFHNTISVKSQCSYIIGTDWTCMYIAEDGSNAELHLGADFQLIVMNGLWYYFDAFNNGKLIRIEDPKSDNNISLTYSNVLNIPMLSRITDSVGNYIELNYSNGLLDSTKLVLKKLDNQEKIVEERLYNYSLSSDFTIFELSTVNIKTNYSGDYGQTQNAAIISYTYLNHLLESATEDKSNYKVNYTYSSTRVNSIHISDNNTRLQDINITRNFRQTTYTDQKGNMVLYTFDQYGHSINIRDSYDNIMTQSYQGLYSYLELDNVDINDYYKGLEIVNAFPNYRNNHKLRSTDGVTAQMTNPIFNHSFELGIQGWSVNTGVTISSEERAFGSSSLKIVNSSGTTTAKQTIALPAGLYTVEGWIMNNSSTPGAFIDVWDAHTKGIITKVKGTTWTKYQLTFQIFYPKTVEIQLKNESISSAYFDSIQINFGFNDSRNNLLQNSGFEDYNLSDYTNAGLIREYITPPSHLSKILGSYVMKALGDGSQEKQIFQSYTSSSYYSKTFTISGMAKANAVPYKAQKRDDESLIYDGRFFGIEITITNVGEDTQGYYKTYRFPFVSSVNDWQSIVGSFSIPAGDYSITTAMIYQGENTAYFDNIQLYESSEYTEYGYTVGGYISFLSKPNMTISQTYDDLNDEYVVTKEAMGITREVIRLSIDDKNRLLYTIQDNVITSNSYNSDNQLFKKEIRFDDGNGDSTDDLWFSSSKTYTNNGQYISSIIDEFGNETEYTYNELNGLIQQITDAKGNIKTFVYNLVGNVSQITHENGSGVISSISNYAYDTKGRLSTITKNLMTYEFIYNDLDQITAVKIAGTTIYTLQYVMETHNNLSYATNKISSISYGNSDVIQFEYDSNDYVKLIRLNGTARYQYEYNQNGSIAVYDNLLNSTKYFYTYDYNGRLVSITDHNSNLISYSYDSNGNIDRIGYNIDNVSQSVYYLYNPNTGRFESTVYHIGSSTASKKYDYESDAFKRLNSIYFNYRELDFNQEFTYETPSNTQYGTTSTRINQVRYEITYNDISKLDEIHKYKYDALHNIIEIEISSNSILLYKYNYTYDHLNQLIREDIFVDNSSISSKTIGYWTK